MSLEKFGALHIPDASNAAKPSALVIAQAFLVRPVGDASSTPRTLPLLNTSSNPTGLLLTLHRDLTQEHSLRNALLKNGSQAAGGTARKSRACWEHGPSCSDARAAHSRSFAPGVSPRSRAELVASLTWNEERHAKNSFGAKPAQPDPRCSRGLTLRAEGSSGPHPNRDRPNVSGTFSCWLQQYRTGAPPVNNKVPPWLFTAPARSSTL